MLKHRLNSLLLKLVLKLSRIELGHLHSPDGVVLIVVMLVPHHLILYLQLLEGEGVNVGVSRDHFIVLLLQFVLELKSYYCLFLLLHAYCILFTVLLGFDYLTRRLLIRHLSHLVLGHIKT